MGQSLDIPRVIPEDWQRLDLIISKVKLKLGRQSSPTHVGMTLTGLTASALVGADASKALESVTIGSSLTYTRPTLNAIQDIRITASPTFAGMLISQTAADTPGLLIIQTAGGTGADAFIKFICDVAEGDTIWSAGVDDTGDSFRIAQSAALGTTDRLIIDSSGIFHFNTITIDHSGTRTVRIGQDVDNGAAGIDNVFLGYRAGYNNAADGTDGTRNVYVGQESGAGSTGGTDNTGSENIGVGAETLEYCTTGYENTCVGDEAGKGITTAQGNVAMGNDAMQGDGTNAVTGNFNTSLGTDTLYVVRSGGYNVAVGYQCLFKLTTLSNIVALGYQALYNVVTGETGNIALGYQAGYYVNQTAGTEGEDNVYIGENAGKGTGATNVGAFNIGIGKSALTAIQSGISNIVLGNSAGIVLTTGSNNFLVGNDAGFALTTGDNNCFFGYQAGYKQTTSDNDLIIGYQAGYNDNGDTTIGGNVLMGYQCFYNDNGTSNIGIGYQAGYYNDASGSYGTTNVYIGYQAGLGDSSGFEGRRNVAIGNTALGNGDATSAVENVCIGNAAGRGITSGIRNVFLGHQAGIIDTVGGANVAIGVNALAKNVSTHSSVAIGAFALTNSIATGNIAIGAEAGESNTSGARNAYFGYQAGRYQATGNDNFFLGYQTGLGVSTLSNVSRNTFIGNFAGTAILTGGDSNIFLGFKAGINQTTNSDLLIIDNQDRGSAAAEITDCMICALFNSTVISQTLRFNVGNLSVVSGTPYQYLINNTHEDSDGGRESRIDFKGEQTGGELTTLARIEAGHDGTADDEKGKITLFVNDGDDGNTPTLALEIGSDLLATFAGAITATNYTASNLLTACTTNAGELDFTAASKKLDVEDDAIVSQDYSSDASPQFTGIELGHASDTTVTRVSAGVIAVEGTTVMMVGAAPTAHTIASHSDTTGTGAELNTLTGGGDVGALHTHAAAYQPLDAELTSLATLSYVAASFVKMTGANTFALRTIGETADDLEGTIDHDNLANGGAHDYAYISGNDGATGVTAAELEELSDGSETTLHSHADISGVLVLNTNTITSSTDAADVSACNILLVDATGGDIAIGGFSGGVDHQIVYVFKYLTNNRLTMEHEEGTGTQKLRNDAGGDIAFSNGIYGNICYICKSNKWYQLAYLVSP